MASRTLAHCPVLFIYSAKDKTSEVPKARLSNRATATPDKFCPAEILLFLPFCHFWDSAIE